MVQTVRGRAGAAVLVCAGLLAARQLDYECFVPGNDYPGEPLWVPHNVEDIFVTDEGTVYTNVPWDEAGGNVAEIHADGAMKRKIWVGNHGGGRAVTANDDYIYLAGDNYRKGNQGIDRRDRSNPDKATNVHVDCGDALGLAVSTNRVYASITTENVIKAFDLNLKPQPSEKIAADKPEDLAFDNEGKLWVLQSSTGTILQYDPVSKRKVGEISLPPSVEPTDIAVHESKLYVTDISPDEQVRIYKDITTNPAPDGTFGHKGGIYSGTPGVYAPLKFDKVMGIGLDKKGNIHIANRMTSPKSMGTTVIQKYTPEGVMLWDIMSVLWIDCVSPHPDNENILYGTGEKLGIDYSTGEWTLKATTVDRHRYPDDSRVESGHGGNGKTWMRKVDGAVFMFRVVMNGTAVFMYRFDGRIAVPTGHIFTDELWYDTNGDGRRGSTETRAQSTGKTRGFWVDRNGDIWQASESKGIFKYPAGGIDSHGALPYSPAAREMFPMPSPFTKLRRIRFYPEQNNLMVLNGFTDAYPDSTHHWKRAGKVFAGYENWSGTFRRPDWKIVPRYEEVERWGGGGNVQSFEVRDNYVFFGRCGASENLGVRAGHIDVWKTDSTRVGWMEPCPFVGDKQGWLDMTESIDVFRLSSGHYIVAVEEDYRSKNILYKWCPDNTCGATCVSRPMPSSATPHLDDPPHGTVEVYTLSGRRVATDRFFSSASVVHPPGTFIVRTRGIGGRTRRTVLLNSRIR